MNFLAHLYLSGSNRHIQIGNFIGDHVKGRNHEKFSADIQKGILLHRKIDHYTDTHPIVKQSYRRLNKNYGRYSGIVMDVFYDHYLAKNWDLYSDVSLKNYVTKVHRVLMTNYFKLPNNVKRFLPFMVKSRRLETYATVNGIKRSLEIMSDYSSLPNETDWAIQQLIDFDDEFDQEFKIFFSDVRAMVKEELGENPMGV
ncbi:ACP phosphodiesterase [Carboxylicivirga sp. N1Y90]|uniref:acyl carrier protein phosphodiesterase n=1 Tax=Carboxylicivirga fragile TaxID=3417571 RepID=UPI003D324D25|nr:DUF479 domain-containing protein [Marinilabiliaceae bacterium N1Y90]